MPTPPELLQSLIDRQVSSRLWRGDTTLLVSEQAPAGVHDAITARLGWLTAPVDMRAAVTDLTSFAEAAREQKLTQVYLLGMGGSSLCAEVLRDVPSLHTPRCRLTVLDTTDERIIRNATEALAPDRALFIVASKSGTTVEVTALESHFWSVMTRAVGDEAGRQFVAITDPQSPLTALAAQRRYRRTFLNNPAIGGRYSALSLFGLVPAALLGIDVARLLESGQQMATRCQADNDVNPGLVLGAFLAAHAQQGRDKLTLLLPPVLAPLALWIEQLVAESTGKNNRGVLPIVGEPIGPVADYGSDRVFVGVEQPDSADLAAVAESLEAAGHPVFRLDASAADLGAEFFRWEFATAAAGVALAVNPFDEPNVRDAKVRTNAMLEAHHSVGTFRVDPPFQKGEGYSRREHLPPAVAAYARRRSGRYVAILDYLPGDRDRSAPIASLRATLRHRARLATTYGVGPRYLHSTGQYHKGGPNTGLFMLFTAVDPGGTPVPGTDYTFSTLKHAQALGDFEALAAAGREVVHYHIDDPTVDVSAQLEKIVKAFSETDAK